MDTGWKYLKKVFIRVWNTLFFLAIIKYVITYIARGLQIRNKKSYMHLIIHVLDYKFGDKNVWKLKYDLFEPIIIEFFDLWHHYILI